jgi:heme exporter protein A
MKLEVQDLAVARGGVPLLAGVGFTVEAGQALILRGPNGSGKTTLLRTLAGLQPPLGGLITGGGETIAYAAHADGLKTMLSVAENLRFWADIFGTRNIDGALAAYGLDPLRDRLAGTLSAGQKRRLGLARMLVTGRPVWAMDEPTVSLDVDAVEMFSAAVSGHLSAGGLAVVATHVDLGLGTAEELDLRHFRAAADAMPSQDEAFL